ncbi:hypothetical protein PS15p_204498 [Mucor circinelloides]
MHSAVAFAVSKIRRVKVQGDGIRKGGEVEGDEGNRIKAKEGFYTFCQKDVAFEDGAGNIVTENGKGPMDITEEENPFKLKELASYSVYLAAKNKAVSNESNQVPVKMNQTKNKSEASVVASQNLSIKGNRVSNEIKANAVHLVGVHPKNSARAVALQLKLEPRTTQRWYKS